MKKFSTILVTLLTVVVLDIDGTHIGRMDVFADRRLIARFGVPAELAA